MEPQVWGAEEWKRKDQIGASAATRWDPCARQAQGPHPPVSSPWTAEAAVAARESLVVWCAVGNKEQHKCNRWSHLSNGNVACASAPTTEDCITLILVGGRVWGRVVCVCWGRMCAHLGRPKSRARDPRGHDGCGEVRLTQGGDFFF